MKETIKIVSVLTGVCVVCAFLLAFVDRTAQSKIQTNQKIKIERAIITLAPYADKIEGVKAEKEVYRLFDESGTFKGYAFIAQGQGYQGKIKMLAVIDKDFEKLEGIEVIESIETPGLGAKIQEADFKSQFKDLYVGTPIECVKGASDKNNQIAAITGATVSSRAVVNILNQEILNLKKVCQENE